MIEAAFFWLDRKWSWATWAKLAGVAGAQRDIARFAKRLDQRQRRQLGCYRNPKTGLREVPSQSTFFRALKGRRRLSADPQRKPTDPAGNGPNPGAERLFSLKTRRNAKNARPERRRKTVTVTKCANWSTVRSSQPNWAWSGPSKWPAWTKSAPTKAKPNPRRCGWPPAAMLKLCLLWPCSTLAVASGASKMDCIVRGGADMLLPRRFENVASSAQEWRQGLDLSPARETAEFTGLRSGLSSGSSCLR